MVGLVLPALLLAAASDSEGSNEEVWAERFAQADKERVKKKVPLLTPMEKFQILVRKIPALPIYLVGILEIDDEKGWPLCYSVLYQFGSQGAKEWEREEYLTGPYSDFRRAEEDAKEWASRLLLPLNLSILPGHPHEWCAHETRWSL